MSDPGGSETISLRRALDLDTPSKAPCIALVGSGGKSTLLFQLGRSLPAPVLVSTTTHLSVEQLRWGDVHRVVYTPGEVDHLVEHLTSGVVVVTGEEDGSGRTPGLGAMLMERLANQAQLHKVPLLIEADGSRMKPLKAPAQHEPAIPPYVDSVVVVAGLSGLEKPLDTGWVHRPELFAGLSGLAVGEPVTPAALAKVMSHKQGGLKNIPAGARRFAFLNQAGEAEAEAARFIVPYLLESYESVILAEMQGRGILEVHKRVAGIILAAGGSKRMRQPKQLLRFHGETLVHRAARIAGEAGLSPVVVVVGFDGREVSQAVRDLPVQVVENPNWESGQASSLAAGAAALPEAAGAALFLLADQPLVPAGLLRTLTALYARTLAPIVAASANGRWRNPAVFDARLFQELKQLRGDTGGRVLFQRYPPVPVEWEERALVDIDTFEDYQKLEQLPSEEER